MSVNRRLKRENRRKAPYKLPKLAREANKYHNRAKKHWLGLAENARRSGQALNKARYYELWLRGKWKRWLEENFNGSYETAKVYMRIAKKWDDPRLQEARQSGITLDSINKILQVLSGKRLPNGTLDVKATQLDMCRDYIRKMFAEKLRNEISKDDTVIFAQNDIFDNLWDKLYAQLRHEVCASLEYDPYEYEKDDKFYSRFKQAEKEKREARQKVKQAMNRNRTP